MFDENVQKKALLRDAAGFQILFYYAKILFFAVNASLRWLNNISSLFLSFLLSANHKWSTVWLFIYKSGLAWCLYCTQSAVCAVWAVFLQRWRKIWTILQPMGSRGRNQKKSTKPSWPMRPLKNMKTFFQFLYFFTVPPSPFTGCGRPLVNLLTIVSIIVPLSYKATHKVWIIKDTLFCRCWNWLHPAPPPPLSS